MIPVAQVKKDLFYSRDLKDVIDVLKLMALSEFNRLYANVPVEDAVKEHLASCFRMLGAASGKNPFLVENQSLPAAFLLVCSDESFLGEVNTYVAKTALDQESEKNPLFIVLGERGRQMLEGAGVECIFFPALENEISMERVKEISCHVMDLYRTNRIGSFRVIYMEFLSFTSHRTKVTRLLPCMKLLEHVQDTPATRDTLIEPGSRYIIEYLVKLWLENSMYHIFLSSKLAEWSIKVMRLENSSDELKDMVEALKSQHFKSIHELSDKCIREVFAARTAAQGAR